MWVVVYPFLGVMNADPPENADRFSQSFRMGDLAVGADRLDDLLADSVKWMQAR
ncbi:hypothetical protein D9M68_969450 [compost metagenome]